MKLSFTLLVLSFQFQSNGVDAAGLCRKASSDDYKCGSARGAAPYWPATTTCGLNECCCHDENGWDSMATYQRDTCAGQDNSVIGCFACSGTEACENLDNAHVGDSSCKGQEACEQWGDPPKERLIIGMKSCNGKAACRYVETRVVGITIGDDSCNADFVCMDCESGSIVPDGTCNDVNNLDEVGQLETYKDYGYVHDEGYRCRACFVSTFYIFSSFELMMCTNHILIMLSYVLIPRLNSARATMLFRLRPHQQYVVISHHPHRHHHQLVIPYVPWLNPMVWTHTVPALLKR